MSKIYQPAEDSFLLANILKKEIPFLLKKDKNIKFLEVGSGSGILLETAKQLGIKNEHITGVDINQEAVQHCKSLGFNCIYSNLFENVGGIFDLIIFNPPYLPKDRREPKESQLATTGGDNGGEIINRFLKQAGNYLEENGKIFLLISSLTKGIDFGDYHKKILGKEKLFFEHLCVFEISKKNFMDEQVHEIKS